MRSYLDALLRYFEFSGRTGRAQYWLYQLVTLIIVGGAIYYEYRSTGLLPAEDNLSPLMIFLSLFHIIPGITVTVRRLHDIGKSGWWYLLNFVPFGGLWVLVWTCCASEPGSNEYGDRDGEPTRRRNSRRAEPEPYYARALRPSAASNPAGGSSRLNGSTERFI
ncbi:MAG: hypothetical protein JWP26_2555 [Devosia sp.]|uniref:DUF805 domain-containing protein n=1 Tax=Devosia sp. TaxID=1871048 RepID=UPI00262C87F4|nr:DUF805 domain-containing protein [Devosia sp.]MDB5587585.1 hypothetical protein [Devosia sp.]